MRYSVVTTFMTILIAVSTSGCRSGFSWDWWRVGDTGAPDNSAIARSAGVELPTANISPGDPVPSSGDSSPSSGNAVVADYSGVDGATNNPAGSATGATTASPSSTPSTAYPHTEAIAHSPTSAANSGGNSAYSQQGAYNPSAYQETAAENTASQFAATTATTTPENRYGGNPGVAIGDRYAAGTDQHTSPTNATSASSDRYAAGSRYEQPATDGQTPSSPAHPTNLAATGSAGVSQDVYAPPATTSQASSIAAGASQLPSSPTVGDRYGASSGSVATTDTTLPLPATTGAVDGNSYRDQNPTDTAYIRTADASTRHSGIGVPVGGAPSGSYGAEPNTPPTASGDSRLLPGAHPPQRPYLPAGTQRFVPGGATFPPRPDIMQNNTDNGVQPATYHASERAAEIPGVENQFPASSTPDGFVPDSTIQSNPGTSYPGANGSGVYPTTNPSYNSGSGGRY